jgi:hypothetical protein
MADYMVGGRAAPHGAGVKRKSKSKTASYTYAELVRQQLRAQAERPPLSPPEVSKVMASWGGATSAPSMYGNITADQTAAHQGRWIGGDSALGTGVPPSAVAGLAAPSYLSVDDLVKLANAKIPTAPHMTAPTIDIGAIQKLYDQGKAAANTTAATTRTDLGGVHKQALEQLALSKVAQKANADASVVAQTAGAANNAVGAAGDVQGSIDMLRQNGASPEAINELLAQQADAAKQMTATGALGTDLTKANAATMQQINGQQGFDENQSHLGAQRAVDQNLVATLLGLDAKRTSAVADATAQNAAAAQQAAQANAQLDQQAWMNRQAVRQQLLDKAAADGTLATPFRQDALDAVGAHGKSGDYFNMVLQATNQQAALDGVAPDAAAFMDNWDTVMRAQAKKLGFKSMPWNRDWYLDQARAYYAQDPSRIDADAAKRYIASLG